MHLQQLTISWWKQEAPHKLKTIYKAMPGIIMWSLWKSRNAFKHDNDIRYERMVDLVMKVVRQMVKCQFPWIMNISWSSQELIFSLNNYKPKLHFLSVIWRPPETHQVKCNTHGECRENPGQNSYGFCIRASRGDLIYAKAKGIGWTTNQETEAMAMLSALIECLKRRL
uniref:Putative ovule protein n=1 Tax=Solanum chacoense TaxID=4108 RepID=A0A0V0IS15_SOLCH